MPQLNPNPWFLIMVSSWLIFLLMMQPKLASFNSTNPPSNKTQLTTQPLPWSWPWI